MNVSTKFSPVGERFVQIAQRKGLSIRKMCEMIGRHTTYIHQLRTTPDEDVLKKVLELFPDVSLVWLLTGVGDPINDPNYGYFNRRNAERIEELERVLEQKENDIRQKDNIIGKLVEALGADR